MGASESKADWLTNCFDQCGHEQIKEQTRADETDQLPHQRPSVKKTRPTIIVPKEGDDARVDSVSPHTEVLSLLDMRKQLTAREERTLGMKLSVLHYEEREKFCCRSNLQQEQKKRLCDAVQEFFLHWNRLSQAERGELIKAEKLTKDEEIHIGFLESQATLTNFLSHVKRSKAMRMSPTIRSPELPSSPANATATPGSPLTRTQSLTQAQSRSVSPSIRAPGGEGADSQQPGGSPKNITLASKGRSASLNSKGLAKRASVSEPSTSDGNDIPRGNMRALAAQGRVGSGSFGKKGAPRSAGTPFTATPMDTRA